MASASQKSGAGPVGGFAVDLVEHLDGLRVVAGLVIGHGEHGRLVGADFAVLERRSPR